MWFKKVIIPIGFLSALASAAGVFAWWVRQPSQLPTPDFQHGGCEQIGIVFDDLAISKQFHQTNTILEDPEGFWIQDRAHSLVATSPRINPESLPPEDWLQEMEALVNLSPEARLEQTPYRASQEIMEYRGSFCALGVPVIFSLLPAGTDLDTTIHLAAFTEPGAFTAKSNVVMNVDASNYFGKSSTFLNALGHELFHIGYWRYQPYQQEIWPQNYSLKAALVTLQNEGMATYSQELNNALYPAPLEIDLLISHNRLLVRYLVGRVNTLLQQASSLPEEQAIRIIYSGINQRALYAVGAHMARTIDHELGRIALAETVSLGPSNFIQRYNRLVDESWRIIEVPVSEEHNPFQRLRQAALERNYDLVQDILQEIKSSPPENENGAIFEEIRSAGLVLVESGELDLGVLVFETMVNVFPDHPYSYIHLAEAYQTRGNYDLAEDCYASALGLDPTLISLID